MRLDRRRGRLDTEMVRTFILGKRAGTSVILAALLGGELSFVFRPDDDGNGESAFVPALWPAVEASVLVAPHVDIVLGGGYRFGIEAQDRQIPGDDADMSDATFEGSEPSVSTTGAFAAVGMRYSFFRIDRPHRSRDPSRLPGAVAGAAPSTRYASPV